MALVRVFCPSLIRNRPTFLIFTMVNQLHSCQPSAKGPRNGIRTLYESYYAVNHVGDDSLNLND